MEKGTGDSARNARAGGGSSRRRPIQDRQIRAMVERHQSEEGCIRFATHAWGRCSVAWTLATTEPAWIFLVGWPDLEPPPASSKPMVSKLGGRGAKRAGREGKDETRAAGNERADTPTRAAVRKTVYSAQSTTYSARHGREPPEHNGDKRHGVTRETAEGRGAPDAAYM